MLECKGLREDEVESFWGLRTEKKTFKKRHLIEFSNLMSLKTGWNNSFLLQQIPCENDNLHN